MIRRPPGPSRTAPLSPCTTPCRLFGLVRATDTELETLDRRSDLLLAASEASGFGVPLIEAAHRGLPVLARDIPVFREVAGEHAAYFNGFEASDLANALVDRSEEHSSELPSLMRISYAVFCLKQKMKQS